MPKMLALTRVYYPLGPGGREYKAGEEFEVASERDAERLVMIRKARHAQSVNGPRRPGRKGKAETPKSPEAMPSNPESPSQSDVQLLDVGDMFGESRAPGEPGAEGAPSQGGHYNRRDMRAED